MAIIRKTILSVIPKILNTMLVMGPLCLMIGLVFKVLWVFMIGVYALGIVVLVFIATIVANIWIKEREQMKDNNLRRTKELITLAECTDKPVKRLCVDFGLYISCMCAIQLSKDEIESLFNSYIEDYKEMVQESEMEQGKFRQSTIFEAEQ